MNLYNWVNHSDKLLQVPNLVLTGTQLEHSETSKTA